MSKKKSNERSDRLTEVLCISINPRLLAEAHSKQPVIEAMLITDFQICFYPDVNGQMRIQRIDTDSTNYTVLGKTTMYYWLAKDIENFLKHKGPIVTRTEHIWGLAQTSGHFNPHSNHH